MQHFGIGRQRGGQNKSIFLFIIIIWIYSNYTDYSLKSDA